MAIETVWTKFLEDRFKFFGAKSIGEEIQISGGNTYVLVTDFNIWDTTVKVKFGEQWFDCVTVRLRNGIEVVEEGTYWTLFKLDFKITEKMMNDLGKDSSLGICCCCLIPVNLDTIGKKTFICKGCEDHLVNYITRCAKDLGKLVRGGHITYTDAETIAVSLRAYFRGDVLDEIANGILDKED